MRERFSPPGPAGMRELEQFGAMATLTVLAGAIDAISFLALGHVFTALATGNLLFLSFALAGHGHVPAARPAVALAAFALGAGLGSLFLRPLVARGLRWFPAALVMEGVVLAAAGALALWQHGTAVLNERPDILVIALVGLAMGMRADAVLRTGVPGMPTLLIQMSLVSLLHDLTAGPRTSRTAHERRMARLRLTGTIVGIFAGGFLGALIVPWGTGRALLTVAAGVLVVAALHVLIPRYPAPSEAGQGAS
ncbi:YoaK family protein [Streptomyces sp. NPDC002004]